jgi:S1-C subfamily serine protease
MKKRVNVLYALVFTLIIIQTLTFISMGTQFSSIAEKQMEIETEFLSKINKLESETQFKTNEIIEIISQQKLDIREEIELLKSENDFSEVIQNVIRNVVSIRTDTSSASGFFVSPSYVVTNFHVIEGSEFIEIKNYDGGISLANLIGKDEFTDMALLKIDSSSEYLIFGNSDEIQIGEKVIAIGNPLGLSFTVTEGIVSGTKEKGPNELEAYVQTDAALNLGNSGGPLINKDGKVIGINNFKIGDAENLGFALESNVIKEKLNELAGEEIIE